MLEIRNLSKIYKPKRGVPVKALDSVSLTFPEKGMVFLLGKSGSGKSTLLNLLGGLDSYDSGEILIAGKSSRKFRGKDFDSYRNTLVGFIFQEYNVLDEFTVGANIGLALELQGKKATDEKISAILEEVDLAGYGARRPNELSGGQKQRVAIARALVKDPKIIMADEPTGALDSVTGRQVLDTLKSLSREKLVLVVSHDREFAQRYADRIVELSDGKVISDREFFGAEVAFRETGIVYGEGEIRLSSGYRLTEEDRENINEYLAAMEEGKSLSIRGDEQGMRESRETDNASVPKVSREIPFIPSRLPAGPAFRIGASALKHKKIRLAFTIFLSCVAFGLFGLADTFGAYDHLKTCTQSILDSRITYATLEKQIKIEEGDYEYYRKERKIKEEEIPSLEEKSKISLMGVFRPQRQTLSFHDSFDPEGEFTQSDFRIHATHFNGFAQIGEGDLERMEIPLLAGRIPKGDEKEVAISSYVCETFYVGGFLKENSENGKEAQYDQIKTPEDMLGRKFSLLGEEYTVVGVFSSDGILDLDRYRSLTEKKPDESNAEMLLNYALFQELDGILNDSLATTALVGEGHLSNLLAKESPFEQLENGFFELWKEIPGEKYGGYQTLGIEDFGTLSQGKTYDIFWLGEEKGTLKENEVVLSLSTFANQLGFSPEHHEAYSQNTGEILFSKLTPSDREKLSLMIESAQGYNLRAFRWDTGNEEKEVLDIKVVGILLPDEEGKKAQLGSVCLVADALLEGMTLPNEGEYSFVVGQMPKDKAGVERLVAMGLAQEEVRFALQNPVVFELDVVNEILQVLSEVFLYVGIFFAVFASLMLANFIGTSVAFKKQEIGILRAIGARSLDVFRIFFSESFVIAMICFVLSSLGTFGVVSLVNYVLRTETGILVTVLIFTLRQVALLLGVSLLVAFLGSFFPVKKIASKKPIDAIRGR